MNNEVSPRIDQFLAFYNDLSSDNLKRLAEVYHQDVVFIDPIHQIDGRAALSQYFEHAYARLQFCDFVGKDRLEQGDQGCLSWLMQFRHPAFASGKTISVEGCTVLRWQQGLIVYHRDYYDLNEMVLQHLPVVGWVTSKIKQRMANTQ